ncbi:MAG: AbrB/MazE/SpoVT family DNA-binding domain-containing protein [Candidatus Gracilibacteria bacterium]|nr:AbrB/MazE/SpoVT family DNA-binding domain-containing protein [Candidatus Gracilibacteria bacterium]
MDKELCDIKLFGTTNIGPKGQIVIPKELRDRLNLNPGDSVGIIVKNDKYIGLIKNQDIRDLMEYLSSLDK